MTGQIKINYEAVYAKTAEILNRMHAELEDADSEYRQVRAILHGMDGSTNATLLEALELSYIKTKVTIETVCKLVLYIDRSAQKIEKSELELKRMFAMGIIDSSHLDSGAAGVALSNVLSNAMGTLGAINELNTAATGGIGANGISFSAWQSQQGNPPSMQNRSGVSNSDISNDASFQNSNHVQSVSEILNAHGNLSLLQGVMASRTGTHVSNNPALWDTNNVPIGPGNIQFMQDALGTSDAGLPSSPVSAALQQLSGMISALSTHGSSGVFDGRFAALSGLGGAAGASAMGGNNPMAAGSSGTDNGSFGGTTWGAGAFHRAAAKVSASLNAFRDRFSNPAQGSMDDTSITLNDDWIWVSDLLSRPASQLTPDCYVQLAMFFVLLDNVADQELFLNLLADEVEFPEDYIVIDGTRRIVNNQMHGNTAFTICPDKVAGIQGQIEIAIAVALETQFELVRQGERMANSAYVNNINHQRRILMKRSALLTVADDLAELTSQLRGTSNHIVQPVLMGDGNSLGPFSLGHTKGTIGSDSTPELVSVSISVNHGSLTKFVGSSAMTVHLNPLTNNLNARGNNEIIVGTVAFRGEASAQSIERSGEFFHEKHQFDATSFMMSQAVSFARSTVVGATVGAIKDIGVTAANVASDALKYFDTGLKLNSSLDSARSRAEGIQRDIMSMVDSGIAGVFYNELRLDVVFISEEGRLPQPILWPTVESYAALHALNTVARQELVWDEFLQNPGGEAFKVFSLGARGHNPSCDYIRDSSRACSCGGMWRLFAREELSPQVDDSIDDNIVPQLPSQHLSVNNQDGISDAQDQF